MGRRKTKEEDPNEELVRECQNIIDDERSTIDMKICAAETLMLIYKRRAQTFKVEKNDVD